MNIKELKQKPIWQMTGEEFLYLQQDGTAQHPSQPTTVIDSTKKRHVYGINGIAKLFANRIKKSGKINRAITQIGRKIIVDAELALELAGRKDGGR